MTPFYLAALLVAVVGAAEQRITAPGCGQTPLRSHASQFIVSGVEASPYSWPFICSLEYNGYHICGGSLVKNTEGTYYFITAAHCIDRAARFYSISCAIHDRVGSNPYKQTFQFSSVINHEGYDANTFANDISVMVMSSQPNENNYLQPVCVANSDYYGGETSYVIGWGTTSEGVVSWGYGCARPQYPGVYADVFRFRNWLNSKINA